jgi:hypothetical protein
MSNDKPFSAYRWGIPGIRDMEYGEGGDKEKTSGDLELTGK